MMEADNLIPANGHEDGHENDGHEQPPVSGVEDSISEKVNDIVASEIENKEVVVEVNESAPVDTSHEKVTEESQINTEVTLVPEEHGANDSNQPKHPKLQGQGKGKIEKPPSPKHDATTRVKKSKDVKVTASVSNGSLASHPKQPFKSRSFNDRHMTKQSGKIGTSLTENVTQMDGLSENTKPKTLKKVLLGKADGETQSSPSAAGDDKRVGALPKYSFSFKCDERAEKRREFYSKLEEKIHAKEAEKTTLQAKSKESQEAEIKMLRKSLTFKASPMPSFYQEPPPPKLELKKIPTTRAKSPKLGRKKTLPTSDSDVNRGHNISSGRLSLGEKVSQNNLSKGASLVHPKKPLRKSLPKLPSEKATLSNAKNEVPTVAEVEKSILTTEPNQSEAKADGISVAEEQTQPNQLHQQVQLSSFQEPIALEHQE